MKRMEGIVGTGSKKVKVEVEEQAGQSGLVEAARLHAFFVIIDVYSLLAIESASSRCTFSLKCLAILKVERPCSSREAHTWW